MNDNRLTLSNGRWTYCTLKTIYSCKWIRKFEKKTTKGVKNDIFSITSVSKNKIHKQSSPQKNVKH